MFEPLFAHRGLSLDRLRSFLEMAEAGGIAKAAPGDAVRQSQISRQIRELEAFFETKLTLRRGKSLALTPSGRRLAGLIRGQLQGLEDFRREQQGQPKVFGIGAGNSTLEWLITPRLPRISDALGGARLHTEMFRSRALVEAVQEGRIDLAVVRGDALPDAVREHSRPVLPLTFHLCVPRILLPGETTAEALAEADRWRDLPFAAGRDGGQTDQAIRDAMTNSGVIFRPRFECVSMIQVLQLVARECCAAVLPSMALPGLDETRIFIAPFPPLRKFHRTLVLHWNPRQMEHRSVAEAPLEAIAALLGERRGADTNLARGKRRVGQ